MNILKSLFGMTLIGKTCHLLGSLYNYCHEYNLVSGVLYSEGFKEMIRKYLRIELQKDWIGRLYGIINPSIDLKGNIDMSNTIIEIDGDMTNNNEYVQQWVYKQLMTISSLFQMDRLYQYISMEFEHVGPINGDNYLVVFDLTSRKDLSKSFGRFFIHLLIYAIIFLIIFYGFL